MKKLLISFIFPLMLASSTFAQERSPFTNIDFGLFLGWGNFIKVQNWDYFDEDKTHFLIEVNGKGYKEIISEAKALYGNSWKCQMAEHFVETMSALGVEVKETVDLKLYLFDGGHEVISLKDVPVTEENLEEIQFETNHCKN
ncbi:MAG: hypothetical protein VXV96_17165 [Bdellovibrionota bacterium]|nr:hypothetical protein [Bdellovibrionota bacterium]